MLYGHALANKNKQTGAVVESRVNCSRRVFLCPVEVALNDHKRFITIATIDLLLTVVSVWKIPCLNIQILSTTKITGRYCYHFIVFVVCRVGLLLALYYLALTPYRIASSSTSVFISFRVLNLMQYPLTLALPIFSPYVWAKYVLSFIPRM